MANAFAFDDDDEPPKKKARRPADADDDVPPSPKKKPLPVKPVAKAMRPVEDEDDEEELPRPKKASKRAMDDDDEGPRKRRKATKKKSKLPLILGLAAVALVFGCGGLFVVLDYTVFHVVLGSGDAKGTFLSYQSAVRAERWGDAYDLMDKESQGDTAKEMKPGKSGRSGFIETMRDPSAGKPLATFYKLRVAGTIESVEEKGDTATIKLKPDIAAYGAALPAGAKPPPDIYGMSSVELVREGGRWKVNW